MLGRRPVANIHLIDHDFVVPGQFDAKAVVDGLDARRSAW